MGLSKVSFTIDNSKVIEVLKSLLDMDIQDLEIKKSENKNLKSPLWDDILHPKDEIIIRKDSDKDLSSLEDLKRNTLVPNWVYHRTSTTADN